jgi:hypothetical protein
MPFSLRIKTNVFIRSARLCCLCLKQCGTKIEAAHIIPESENGMSEEDNCIPLCFDCHQEVGSYNNQHPRGNKFRPKELRAHRDRVYRLVESGVLFANIIAARSRQNLTPSGHVEEIKTPANQKPSQDAKRLLDVFLSSSSPPDAPARKLRLLNDTDRAYVVDSLLDKSPEKRSAAIAMVRIATPKYMDADETLIVLERLLRNVVFFGEVESKAALLSEIKTETLAELTDQLKLALFEDSFEIIARDQFSEVNELVPAIIKHDDSIPGELHGEYVVTLLKQAKSDSYHGAPAARRALSSLPDAMARAGIEKVDAKFLDRYGRNEVIENFIRKHDKFATKTQRGMFRDFLELPLREFWAKYGLR